MSEAKADATYRVGVDRGGTFTGPISVDMTRGAITIGEAKRPPASVIGSSPLARIVVRAAIRW